MAACSQAASGAMPAPASMRLKHAVAPPRPALHTGPSSGGRSVPGVTCGSQAASASSLRLGILQVQTCSGGLARCAAH